MKDFRRNYLIFLMIAGLFVAAIGLFSYSKFRESGIRGERAQTSHKVLKDASRLRALVFQEISDYRSYKISGIKSELDAYNLDKELSTKILDGLKKEISGNELQQNQTGVIEKNYIDFIDTLEGKAGAKAGSAALYNAVDKMITSIDVFIDNEEQIFNARLENLIALNRNFYIAIVIGTFSAFALLMFMNYYLLLAQYREASIQKQFEELKERQAQSFQATQDGLFEWKFQEIEPDKAMYWSPRLKEMIGYTDHDLKASAETLESLMHPEDREGFWQQLHRHLRGELPEFSAFFRWKSREGDWVWINSRGRAVLNGVGDPVKLIGVHTDVTRLKEYELQLAKSKDDAEKANSAKSDFLAHMSHEIRTPLTAITGVAEILDMQKAKFDEKTQRLMVALNASAIGLRDLISDILDFSKIESGKIVFEKMEIDIHEFLENTMSIVSLRAAEKNLSLICDYSTIDGLNIIGDKTRLRQILINLIGNAVKFTAKGSVQIKAEILKRDNGEILSVIVKDTGIGIAEEQLPYIFDSFRQADASVSRKYGGTGLGLPIAKQLTQMMGGNLIAESKLGEGSVFRLEMPVVRAEISESHELHDKEENKLGFDEKDKILVVEDYEGNIAFLTHILDEMGIKYDLGRTGFEGLKLWRDNKYKMILMDIQMPELDGISAVKHIRSMEREQDASPVPIIAMTAHAFSEDKEKCLKAGFSAYLPKPLSKENLFEKMSELIAAA